MPEKQQFNVNLPRDLVRALKHRSIDDQLSLSDWVERALRIRLEDSPVPNDVTLQPLVHVPDLASAVVFYEALGARVRHGSRDGDFALLELDGATLAVLAHPPNPEQGGHPVELAFACPDLTALHERLVARGVDAAPPTDEGFGRQMLLRAPGGTLVKVNELDETLYT